MQSLIQWFKDLTPESLQQIDQFYQSNSEFSDPFNRVHGREKIHHLFNEMFELDDARFELLDSVEQGHKLFITWNLYFSIWGKPQRIHGGSYIQVGDDGLVSSHHDYWDAAEQVYEKIPLLGQAIRLVKKRFQ